MRRAIITFFGCGEMHFASGTWGSAGALIVAGIWYALCRLFNPTIFEVLWNYGLIAGLIASCGLSIAWGRWAVEFFANHHNTRKEGDPGAFVLDEVAGMWLALLWLPMATWEHAIWIACIQFVSFRIADVWKPWPGKSLEKLPHGWGILFDDLSSALYCNLVAQFIFRIALGWE